MLTKRFLFIGAHLLLVILLLTSVAYSQFMRIDGPDGEGYGYGFGFGYGYGWDGDANVFGDGCGLGCRIYSALADDIWGYGYGIGFMIHEGPYPEFYNAETGKYTLLDTGYGFSFLEDGESFMQIMQLGAMTGVMVPENLVLDDEAKTATITGFSLLAPVDFHIGDVAIVSVLASTTFHVATPREAMTENHFTATSTADITGLPDDYLAIINTALQFGYPDAEITLNKPVTITINVGSSYNGTTLSVLSKSVGGNWEPLTTCSVSSSLCTFTTTHLSSFTTATYTAPASTPTEETSTSNSSGYIQLTSPTSNSVTITRTLRYGTYNSEVKNLQQLLKDLGYLKIKKTTTFFGLATRTALKKFQKEHGLKVTGIADLATRRALKNH